VDYEGSGTDSTASLNYSMQAYANDVVAALGVRCFSDIDQCMIASILWSAAPPQDYAGRASLPPKVRSKLRRDFIEARSAEWSWRPVKQDVCLEKGIAAPYIVSESGRALASHHAVMIFDVLSRFHPHAAGMPQRYCQMPQCIRNNTMPPAVALTLHGCLCRIQMSVTGS